MWHSIQDGYTYSGSDGSEKNGVGGHSYCIANDISLSKVLGENKNQGT